MNLKRYMNASMLYAILAMAGGVFYRQNFPRSRAYTLLPAGHGRLPFVTPARKELCLYWSKDEASVADLSYRSEPNCCDACGAGCDASIRGCSLL